jgi:signal peptidase I
MKQMAKAAVKRKSSGLLDNVKTIIYAALIAIGIRTIAFEPFNIPSGSMIPTLLVGDYLFVSKYSYGYSRFSLPWPLSSIDWSGRVFNTLPTRGDVAVFKLPSDTSIDYIKRVIGLPGDHVQMRDGNLYINGTLVPRTPDGQCAADDDGVPMVASKYIETLPNGVRHPICKMTNEGEQNNTPDFLVPPNRVFVMGDNRDNSLDSRFMTRGVGFVPLENLVGRAELIFFSTDGQYPWWQVWEWPVEIRWGRLLHGIH